MEKKIQRLMDQLYIENDDVRGLALAELIKLGKPGIPALLKMLEVTDSKVRALAMEGLAIIADASCSDQFHAALEDENEYVRAWAANGLARINDPDAMAALIETFHDYPDELHSQHTLSSYTLIGMGPSVLPKIALLLSHSNVNTRERAYWTIAGIVNRISEYKNNWHSLSKRLGNYDPYSTIGSQKKAVSQWMEWCKKFQK